MAKATATSQIWTRLIRAFVRHTGSVALDIAHQTPGLVTSAFRNDDVEAVVHDRLAATRGRAAACGRRPRQAADPRSGGNHARPGLACGAAWCGRPGRSAGPRRS